MKVFEVLVDDHKEESKKVVEMRMYVTHESDSLLAVTEFYTQECAELEQDLKSVREVLVVCHQIKKE